MRVLCIAVIALGYVAAFVPSLYPSTTARRSNYSSKQLQAKQKPQRCDVLLRTTAAAAASADFDEQTEEQGLRAGGTEGGKEPTIGVIVCDHGSRRENANDMLFEVAERYRSFAGCDIVEVSVTFVFELLPDYRLRTFFFFGRWQISVVQTAVLI